MEDRINNWRRSLNKLRLEPGQVAELEQHLSDTIDELLIKGYDEERAFEEASKRIGNPRTIAKQEWNVNGKRQRRSTMPALVPVYFTQAWRQLKRSRLHTFITMVGMMMGLAGCVLLAIYVQFERSYDKFHPDHEQVYRIVVNDTRSGQTVQNLWMPTNLTMNLESSISAVTAASEIYVFDRLRFSFADQRQIPMRALSADSSFNEIFRFPLVDGSNIPDPDANGVYITRSAARRMFGTEQAVGKAIIWHDDRRDREMVVRGILADVPGNSHFDFEMVVPGFIASYYRPGPVQWRGGSGHKGYLRVTEGTDPAELTRQLIDFQVATGADTSTTKLSLMPLADIHLNSHLRYEFKVNGDKRTIFLFAMISALILLIACVNYAIISMSRYVRRIRELGMRKVLGADRLSILLQFAVESALQLLFIIPVALLLVWLLLPQLGVVMNRSFGPLFPEYLGIVAVSVALVSLCVIAAGVIPALVLHGNHAMDSLHGRLLNQRTSSYVQRGAVALQFAIAAFLLIYLGGVYQQMHFVRTLDLGYNPDNLMHIAVNSPRAPQLIKNRLASVPGVESVSVSNWLPGKSSMSGRFEAPDGSSQQIEAVDGDHDFLQTMGMTLIEGRNFDPGNSADTLHLGRGMIDQIYFENMSKYPILLNKKAVEVLGLEKPYLGTELRDKIPGRVIGIIDDVKFFSLHQAVMPMKVTFDNIGFGLLIRYHPGRLEEVRAALEHIYTEITGSTALETVYIDEYLASLYEAEEREATLITASVVLALVLSLMGLLGMVIFALEQRTKEIGIRKVLGASIGQIVWLLTRRYALLIVAGSLTAIPLAHWLLQNWLQGFAYRAQPAWWLYGAAVFATLAIAWLVIGLQAGKAALANPVKALRSE